MNKEQPYSIGVPGEPWNQAHKREWLSQQSIKRSYKNDVLAVLDRLPEDFKVSQYGALSHDAKRYPLFAVSSSNYNSSKPNALVTGGVHGYETSGIHGALRFIENHLQDYSAAFNITVLPCISPWGYETINRWNPSAVDPNRSFIPNSSAEESAAVFELLHGLDFEVHIDLHETTDTDNTEFRPALSARDNVYHPFWEIPDGFYLVGDSENPCDDFQAAIIIAVSEVTHIAPADHNGRIIGELTTQTGVINYATKELGLCTGFSDARFNTTTEVYPDSPLVDDENCISAQVAAVCSGLDFVQEFDK